MVPQSVDVQPILDTHHLQMSREEADAIMSPPLWKSLQMENGFCRNLLAEDPSQTLLVQGLPEGITGCIRKDKNEANQWPGDMLFLELSEDRVLWIGKVLTDVIPEFERDQDFAFSYLKFFMETPDRLIKLGDSYFLAGPNVLEFDLIDTNVQVVTGKGSSDNGVEVTEVSLSDLIESINLVGTLTPEEFDILTNQIKLLLEGKYTPPAPISAYPAGFLGTESFRRLMKIETAGLVILEILLILGLVHLGIEERKVKKIK